MEKHTFQTNINCQNCVRAVTAFLNEVPQLEHWEVDTEDERKILTARGKGLSAAAVMEAVEEAGFDIAVVDS